MQAADSKSHSQNPESSREEWKGSPDVDWRKMEKDKLASKLQTSNQRSILNYQTVEARNQEVQEVGIRDLL